MQHQPPHLSPPGGFSVAPRLAAVAAVAALAVVAALVAVAAMAVAAMKLAAPSQS
jgi:hypothetical protein